MPIPPNARPSAGTDSQITVYQPSHNRLWEYWELRREGDGWHARWGGAIDDVSISPATTHRLPERGAVRVGSERHQSPLVAGTMTLAELRSGHIDHALAISLPDPRAGVVAWRRSDRMGPGPRRSCRKELI